jgi:hypothetical protein
LHSSSKNCFSKWHADSVQWTQLMSQALNKALKNHDHTAQVEPEVWLNVQREELKKKENKKALKKKEKEKEKKSRAQAPPPRKSKLGPAPPSVEAALAARSLAEEVVAGDGNCMFHAVAHRLAAHGDSTFTHQALRQIAVECLRDHWADFVVYFDAESGNESYDAFCLRLSLDREWGDQLVLVALCRALNVSITVLSDAIPEPTEINSGEARSIGFILFRNNNHFNSTKAAGENGETDGFVYSSEEY